MGPGTIGGRDDLPVNDQLQTLQLIEVGVDVGLRMQSHMPLRPELRAAPSMRLV